MKCPNCSTENAPDSKFCENCGKPLDSACPNCGKPVTPGAKFCRNCGYNLVGATTPASAERLGTLRRAAPSELQSKVLSARGQMEGERKLVTVLFTDIVGSTSLAEKLDPEVWGEIVTGAHQRVSEAVYRYEGTIAQLLGDGVLAFFGAPLAHEDDAERAIRASLDILVSVKEYAKELRQKKRVEDFQMRVGLNTGQVVVGNIGSDLHMEYLAVGDTVNLAARMQSAADPNTVLVAEYTHRLAAKLFDYEDRGKITVKGKAEPVQVYRVIGARASGVVRTRGIEGLDSPLVGREHEMQMFISRVGDLMNGRGQIVSIMGEAGLGKSRLMAEARMALTEDGKQKTESVYSIAGHPSSIVWLEGRSLSFETATPYSPFIDLFTTYFNLHGEDTDADKYAMITTRVAELLPGQVKEIAPFVATLLNIESLGEDQERVQYLDPPSLRGRTFAAVRAFFEQLAGTTPLVLVFEDLHWADSTSLDLIQELMPLSDQKMIMLVALFRPLRQEPSWRFHEIAARDFSHRYTSIPLEPLDGANARQLVANLLEIEDLPEQVRALILKKAEGNPFFVEEVIRSLLDAKLVMRDDGHWRATREIENIALPDTLAGVIAARLDRLDEDAKHTAQAASVVGREFQRLVLTDISDVPQSIDPSLVTLQRRELVREKADVPERAYLFKHALTQETAYGSILMSKRRDLHRRVAECLEKIAPQRINDIAHHFLEAQEAARALPYLVKAGENAARTYSTPEAIGYFSQGVEIAQNLGDSALARRAYEGLGSALTLVNDLPRAIQNYQAMLAYAQSNHDTPMQVSAHNKLAYVQMFFGDFENAEGNLVQAEQQARAAQDRLGLSEMFTIRCGICTASGDFDSAVKYLTESTQVGRELNAKEQMAYGLTHTANTLLFMTRFDEAWDKAQEALRVIEDVGDRARETELLGSTIPAIHLRNGDLDAARREATRGVEIAMRIGSAFGGVFGNWTLGTLARLRGEYEDATRLYRRSLEIGRAAFPMLQVLPLAALGTTLLEISPAFTEESAELHTQALKIMEHPMGASLGGGIGWADIGFCALGLNNLDTATDLFEKGLNHPTTLGLVFKPSHLLGMAYVALARHRFDQAAQYLDEARAYAETRAMKNALPEIALAEARVSAARGDTARGLEQFARAEELAAPMSMRPIIWQARAGAAQSLAVLGRPDEAETKRQSAQAMIEEIAALFKDEKLKAMYIESALQKSDEWIDHATGG